MHVQEFFNIGRMENPIVPIKSFSLANCKKIACAILFLFIINYSFCQPNTTAIKGVLNLQQHNWAKDGLADLNGQWEFYWNSLDTPSFFVSAINKPPVYANVPGFWNNLIPNHNQLRP